MKNFRAIIGASILVALLAAGCGEDNSEENSSGPKEQPTGPDKGQRAGSEAAHKAERQLKRKLVGYWAANESALRKMMTEEIAGTESRDPEAELEAVMRAMTHLSAHIGDESMTLIGWGNTSQEDRYRITTIDTATNTLKGTIISRGGEAEATFTIEGDKLTIASHGELKIFDRILEDEYVERREAWAKSVEEAAEKRPTGLPFKPTERPPTPPLPVPPAPGPNP